MIVRVLVDLNDEGWLYLLTIQTEDKDRLFELLKEHSHDVRFIEEKEEPSKRDTGDRKLDDGSIVLRCQSFGDKVGAMYAFGKSQGKMCTIEKAVVV